MKKRICSLLIATMMMLILVPGIASAETYGGEFNSATSDPNGNKYICIWIFDESSGTLYIEGVGELPEYNDSTNKPPWVDYRSSIKTLVIEEGITVIGKGVFQKHKALTSISFPSTIKQLKARSFMDCDKLESVTLPSTTSVDANAFVNCDKNPTINRE